MRKTRLGIDIHGTLAPFGQYVLNVVNDKFGTCFTENDLTSYYFKDSKGLGSFPQVAEDICNELMNDGWVYGDLDLYPSALQCCKALAEVYDLWAITHVTPAGVLPVCKWVYERGLPMSSTFPVNSPDQKTWLAQQTAGMIEDRAATVNTMSTFGIKCFLVDRPWNQSEVIHSRVVRGTLEEITDILLSRPL